LLGTLETLLRDAKLIKHKYRALLVGFLFILKILLELDKILLVVFHKMLLSLLLSILFNLLVLQLCEVTSILKNLDKTVLLKRLAGCLNDWSDCLDGLF